MPGKSQLTRALLLRSVDYGEADRIVTLLTEEFGKVSALARGARRSKKRFGGALQPGVLLQAAVRFGRGDLASLERVSVDALYLNLLKELARIQALGDALSLVRQLLPAEQPDREVFQATVELLGALDTAGHVNETAVAFEVKLLGLVGFAPHVSACARCGKVPAEGRSALFDPLQSAIVCRACGGGRLKLSGRARELMRASLGAPWQPRAAWETAELDQIRAVLAAIVEPLLGKSRPGASTHTSRLERGIRGHSS